MAGHFMTGEFDTLEAAIQKLREADDFYRATLSLCLEAISISWNYDKKKFEMKVYWRT